VLASNAESERASRELDAMRQEASGESLQREQALREARAELERARTARDDWEAEAMAQRVRVDEARSTLEATYRELAGAKEAGERDAAARDAEAQRANNLQAVLEDFQSGVCMSALSRPKIWFNFAPLFFQRRITNYSKRWASVKHSWSISLNLLPNTNTARCRRRSAFLIHALRLEVTHINLIASIRREFGRQHTEAGFRAGGEREIASHW
jgi:hypothetical protein